MIYDVSDVTESCPDVEVSDVLVVMVVCKARRPGIIIIIVVYARSFPGRKESVEKK